MISSIFRKYDIRGKFGTEFTLADVYPITAAIAQFLKQRAPALTDIAVGMDGRTHSPAIKQEVVQALRDTGFNVTFIGVCSSPVLYFANYLLPVQAGIMITASHNPKAYNGLKIMLQRQSIWNQDLVQIRELYLANRETYLAQRKFVNTNLATHQATCTPPISIDHAAQVVSENHATSPSDLTVSQHPNLSAYQAGLTSIPQTGNYQELELNQQYADYLAAQFPHLQNLPLKFVLDCGHGAASVVVPYLIKKLNWTGVQLLCAQLDGNFPTHQADPSKISNLLDVQALLLADPTLSFGAGLDGDADRLGLVTPTGQLVPNDQLLTLFAEQLAQTQPNLTIVGDVKYSASLRKYLHQKQINTVLAPCGVAFIKAAMQTAQAPLGGELSGHFCFHDRYFGFDDGLYALLRFCEILYLNQTDLMTLLAKLPPVVYSPEIRLACRPEQKAAIVAHTKQQLAQRTDLALIEIDGIRSEHSNGWGGIRASNTEDVLSIRFEGCNPTALQQITTEYYEILKPFFDEQTLKSDLNL